MKTHTASFLRTRTRLQAGSRLTDACYIDRNNTSMVCALMGWPQTDNIDHYLMRGRNPCRGNRNEINLMECLDRISYSWWMNFADCTSDEQCLALAREKDEKMTANL